MVNTEKYWVNSERNQCCIIGSLCYGGCNIGLWKNTNEQEYTHDIDDVPTTRHENIDYFLA